MDHLKVIEEMTEQHTSIAGTGLGNGRSLAGAVGELVDEWHYGAAPRKKMHEFPSEHELEHVRREARRSGRWTFDCVLCDVIVEINPILPRMLDHDRALFIKALAKLPPLATPTRDVHLCTLARALLVEKDPQHALRTMALGACYDIWFFDTPHRMGFSGQEAKRFAAEGLLLVRPSPRNLESTKLPLFSTARP